MARRSRQRRKCKAKTKAGNACGNWAIDGGEVCRKHGGGAPQVKAAAKARVIERKANQAIGAFLAAQEIPYVDPLKALLDEVGRSYVVVQGLGEMLAQLQDPLNPKEPVEYEVEIRPAKVGERIIWRFVNALYGPDHQGDYAPHVLYSMWERARVHHAKVCKLALDAGVAERQVRVAEAEAEIFVKAVEAGMKAAGLTEPQKEKARREVAKHLRLVQSA